MRNLAVSNLGSVLKDHDMNIGQVLTQMWKQIKTMGEIEEMAEIQTEQASDKMFVGLANAESFATKVKLRCDMKFAESTTEWLQERARGKKEIGNSTN